ncbi:MAG: hypothetical protein RRZ92_04220 [Bacilli bacterium]
MKKLILLLPFILLSSCGESTTPSGDPAFLNNQITLTRELAWQNKLNSFYSDKEINSAINIKAAPGSNGKINVNSSSYFGNIEHLTLVPNEGYISAFLLRNDCFYPLDKNKTSFYVTSNITFRPYFISSRENITLYLDEGDKYITHMVSGSSTYQYPVKEGYTIELNESSLFKDTAINSSMVVRPVYKKIGTPVISNVGLTLDPSTYTYNSSVTLTAETSDPSTYITRNNEIIAVGPSVKTTILEDAKYEAKSASTLFLDFPIVSLFSSTSASPTNDSIILKGEVNANTKHQLIDTGIIYKSELNSFFSFAGVTSSGNTIQDSTNTTFKTSIKYKKGFYQAYAIYKFTDSNYSNNRMYFSDIYSI